MNGLSRFSDYDVFAYVASGLAGLVVWDVIVGTHYVLGAEWTASGAALTIGAAYIIGQILASPSAWFLERQFVHRVLLRPSVVLLEDRRLGWRTFLKRTVLQDYYKPLDSRLRRRVRERAASQCGAEPSGEAVFWCAFPVAKRDGNAYPRMDSFLRLYGFCRNMAFVGLVGGCAIAIDAALEWYERGWVGHVVQEFRWALLAVVIGLGMLHRYLKFFRLYSVEVFVTYGEGEWAGSKPV